MKFKKIWGIIFCFAFLLSMWGCHKQQDKEEPKEIDKQVMKTGIIEAFDNTIITLHKQQYDISEVSINFTVHKGDEVKVTYMKSQENKAVIVLKKMRLLKCHYEEKLTAILNAMSLEQKVGQLFMIRPPVYEGVEVVQQYHPGGYIVFDANIQPFSRDQFIENNRAFQASAKIPMFIGIDEEGGSVNRLSWYENYRAQPFLSPQGLYQQGGMDAIRNDTVEKANLLKSVGINVNFAPVADVSTDPNNFIYDRTFGQDQNKTSQYVQNVVEVMKKNGMGSVLKHFPGYGNNADTHTGSSYDTRNLESFRSKDFLPFIAGVNAGADFVLINHNIVSSMDANAPASLSATVHALLREELNFNGVVITDDLVMQAITDEYGDALSAVLAIEAGNDMLISSNFVVQYDAVLQAVKAGRISEERINESIMRILLAKQHLGLLD